MKGREAQLPGLSHLQNHANLSQNQLCKTFVTPRIATIRPGMLGIPQIAGLGFRRGWVFGFGFFVS